MSMSSASWLGSMLNVGALAATPVYAYVCERQSRKMVGYVVGVCGVIGWLLVLLASAETVLLSARVVIGFAASGANILCSVYVPEIVDDDIRGSLGSMINMFMVGGVLFVYVFGSYTPYMVFNVLCFAIPVTFLLVFWWMPESPAYLASMGRDDEAQRARKWLRLQEEVIVQREDNLETNARVPPVKKMFLKEVFANRGVRKATAIGLGLVANNQLTGILAVLTYTVTIFQESGSELSPNVSTIIVGAIQLFAVYVVSFLVDRVGRRALLLAGNISSAVALAILGLFFHLKNTGVDVANFAWLPVTCLCTFVTCTALGAGTVPFIIIGEIFPQEIKNTAICFCISVLQVIARFFLSTVQALGMDGCYWLFTAFCLILSVFTYFFVPETKNRSLDSIFKELNGEDTSSNIDEEKNLS